MIIVGAGLVGCAAARVLAEAGETVQIWERDSHPGGAVYDHPSTDGAYYIHQYGPHIFHTNDEEVFSFISRFSAWTPYRHTVLGLIRGKLCPIPFNFESIELCFPQDVAEKYKQKLREVTGPAGAATIGQLAQEPDQDMQDLARFVYENVFENYTKKQWGMPAHKLGDKVMGRVPVRASFENRYFADKYQLMPEKGYSYFVGQMLSHPNIQVEFGVDATKRIAIEGESLLVDGEIYRQPLMYTACLDELLAYRLGMLPYRSLKFAFEEVTYPHQPVAVVNYPNEHDYTRITELAHFYPGQSPAKSTILYEYPQAYEAGGESKPFYPIPLQGNQDLYVKYRGITDQVANFYPAGRLGAYQYINMDAAILDGIRTAQRILERKRAGI